MSVSTDDMSKETPKHSESSKSSSERPPSYAADPVDPTEQLALELPKLNLGFDSSFKSASNSTITRDQCVAHLKFLAVLADLRDAISGDDGLFDIFDAEAEKFPESLNEARARIREKRWAVYTARAVNRYTTWWSVGLPRSSQMATISDLENVNYESVVNCDTLVAWSPENLPPLGKCTICQE
jgi:hypothetical protein